METDRRNQKQGGRHGLSKRDMGYMHGRQYHRSAVSGGSAPLAVPPERVAPNRRQTHGGNDDGVAEHTELRHRLTHAKPELAVVGAGNMVGDTEFSLGEDTWRHSYIVDSGVLRGYSILFSDLQRRMEPYLLRSVSR